MSNRTKYTNKNASSAVFNNAKPVRGYDSNLYRQDPYGNVIYKHSHGKNSEMGWEIDHIKPRARGGSDDIVNLQALKTEVNRIKSDSLVKKSRHNQ
jgi:5-methylcytosine-specific restriction endonuclease McrA